MSDCSQLETILASIDTKTGQLATAFTNRLTVIESVLQALGKLPPGANRNASIEARLGRLEQRYTAIDSRVKRLEANPPQRGAGDLERRVKELEQALKEQVLLNRALMGNVELLSGALEEINKSSGAQNSALFNLKETLTLAVLQ